jgi:hypothetical protein
MGKVRAPKRKEEYTSPSDIEEIRDDILEKGTLLKTVSGMKFPDAEEVHNAMAQLLDVVEEYELVGKWVSSVTTKEIHEVSIFMQSSSSSLIRGLYLSVFFRKFFVLLSIVCRNRSNVLRQIRTSGGP